MVAGTPALSIKSQEDQVLDPSDPNYKHFQVYNEVYKSNITLPSGWMRNPKAFSGSFGEAPYVHEDGRQSWRNPALSKVREAMDRAYQMITHRDREEEQRRIRKRQLLMIKNEMPLSAIHQMTRMHEIDPRLLNGAKHDTYKDSSSNNKSPTFKPKGNKVEFPSNGDKDSRLALLVCTILDSSFVAVEAESLVVDKKELQSILPSLEYAQGVRDSYNSSAADLGVEMKQSSLVRKWNSLGLFSSNGPSTKVNIQGLDQLVTYLQFHMVKKIPSDDGTYDYPALGKLYKVGTRVVAKNDSGVCDKTYGVVVWNRYGVDGSFKVGLKFSVTIGSHVSVCEVVDTLERFEGRRIIESLNFLPVSSPDLTSQEKRDKGLHEKWPVTEDAKERNNVDIVEETAVVSDETGDVIVEETAVFWEETEDSITVTIEVPGFYMEELTVTFSDFILSVHGVRRDGEDKLEFHEELVVASDMYNTDEMQAFYSENMLNIIIPKFSDVIPVTRSIPLTTIDAISLQHGTYAMAVAE